MGISAVLLQACPLNPNPQPLTGQQELLQDFSKRFSPAIRGVVEFAKRIPGFALLPQDDQVTLLKAGVFEVLLVRLACLFDAQVSTWCVGCSPQIILSSKASMKVLHCNQITEFHYFLQTNSMICLDGQVLKREAIHNSSNARFLMDSMFDFAERLNSLRLSDAEVGLFCSVVVIAPDRPGLRNTELIERMQGKLKAAMQLVVSQNHPGHANICHELMKKIPDLRTLNTLHSEKLLAFKMTEQQQQLQQQQQQLWGGPAEEESNSKSPAGSLSWSSSSDVTMDEAVKSPLGSVSSTESVCSGEVASLTEYQSNHHHMSHQASSAPLLAATLAGGICPHRHRANSGSTSGDDDMMGLPHHSHHGLTITAVNGPPTRQPLIQQHHHRFQRKLDSPSDSGIESGTEKLDKLTSGGGSTGSAPTSVCSSPRSSLEDKDDDKHHSGSSGSSHIDDMPVLKRVLQAPPLYDTNSLMDEAYKPHKKFRACRNKDSAEAEPMIVQVSPPPPSHPVQPQHHSSPQLHLHLTANTQQSLSSSSSAAAAASLLSSTHSTLAKSLMESPRMTAEQMKRTDIIHNYIMRADSPNPVTIEFTHSAVSPTAGTASTTTAPGYKLNSGNLLVCAGSAPGSGYHYIPQQQQPQQVVGRWQTSSSFSNGASVITTTTGRNAAPPQTYVLLQNSSNVSSPVHHAELQQTEFSRICFHPGSAVSPHHASSSSSSSSASPSPLPVPHRKTPPATTSCPSSPSSTGATQLVISSPKMMELQVDIADSQQPLNLSKKSPSPSPHPMASPATTVTHKIVSLEA